MNNPLFHCQFFAGQYVIHSTTTLFQKGKLMNDGLMDAVIQHFEANQFKYEKVEGKNRLFTGFGTPAGNLRATISVEPDSGIVQVHAYAPVNVPENRRQAAAEFFTRANYGIKIGNFELDMNDGEVRYKTSACFRDQPMHPDLMEPLIGMAVSTCAKYLPGISKVAFGGKSAKAAIAEIEGDRSDDTMDELRRLLGDDTPADDSDEADEGEGKRDVA